MKIVNALSATALALSLCVGGSVALADDDLKMEELPQKVQETVRATVGDGEIKEIEKEEKKGRVVYEVDYKKNGQEYEMKVSEDGHLLKNKKD